VPTGLKPRTLGRRGWRTCLACRCNVEMTAHRAMQRPRGPHRRMGADRRRHRPRRASASPPVRPIPTDAPPEPATPSIRLGCASGLPRTSRRHRCLQQGPGRQRAPQPRSPGAGRARGGGHRKCLAGPRLGALPLSGGRLALARISLKLADGRDLLCPRTSRRDGSETPIDTCTLVAVDGEHRRFARRALTLEPQQEWGSRLAAILCCAALGACSEAPQTVAKAGPGPQFPGRSAANAGLPYGLGTDRPGYGNHGQDLGGDLSTEERRALIEYLKTLR
jgi:hypothetical protein